MLTPGTADVMRLRREISVTMAAPAVAVCVPAGRA
jgi:hypothetical protein